MMETNGEYTLSRTLWKSDTLRHPNVILAGFWQLLTVSHSLYTLAILVDKIITLEDIYRTFRTSFWQVQQTQAAYKKGVRFSIPQSQLQQTKQTMMSHDSSAHSTVSVMHCSLRLEGHHFTHLPFRNQNQDLPPAYLFLEVSRVLNLPKLAPFISQARWINMDKQKSA